MSYLKLIAVVTLAAAQAASAQVTVPHTFTPGSPAKASEVNENFSALATAIDATNEDVATVTQDVATLAGQLAALPGSKVYLKQACNGGAETCYLTAGSNAYVNLATLTLPAGSYALAAKLSAYDDNPSRVSPYVEVKWVPDSNIIADVVLHQSFSATTLECTLGPASDTTVGDWSSAYLQFDQKVVTLSVPLTLGASTTIRVGCRVVGQFVADGGNPSSTATATKAAVWGVKLTAVQVGSIVSQ